MRDGSLFRGLNLEFPARRLYSALVRRVIIWAPFLARVQAKIVVQRFLKQRGLCPTFEAEPLTLFINASNDVDVCPSPSTGIGQYE